MVLSVQARERMLPVLACVASMSSLRHALRVDQEVRM